MDRGGWRATVHNITKESGIISQQQQQKKVSDANVLRTWAVVFMKVLGTSLPPSYSAVFTVNSEAVVLFPTMSKWEGSNRGLEVDTGQKHLLRQGFPSERCLKLQTFPVFLPVSHRNSTDGCRYLHAVQSSELSNFLNAQPSTSPTEKHPNPVLKYSIVNSTFCFVSGCRDLYHRRKRHSCADCKKTWLSIYMSV